MWTVQIQRFYIKIAYFHSSIVHLSTTQLRWHSTMLSVKGVWLQITLSHTHIQTPWVTCSALQEMYTLTDIWAKNCGKFLIPPRGHKFTLTSLMAVYKSTLRYGAAEGSYFYSGWQGSHSKTTADGRIWENRQTPKEEVPCWKAGWL